MALLQGKAEEKLARGVAQQCQRVEEKILLHLKGQLEVRPRTSQDPEVVEHPR